MPNSGKMLCTICPWAARNCSTLISSRGSRSRIRRRRRTFSLDTRGRAIRDAAGCGIAEREYEHLDLILRLPGLQLIVIENKVWSLPDDAQLQAYAVGPISRLGTDTAQILLSLTPPAWDEPGTRMLGGRRWDYLSYQELADRLEPVAERLGKSASADDRFAGQLVQRYAAWVKLLCRLAGEVTIAPSEPVLLDDRSRAALERARIHDGISKLRGRRVMAALLEQLRAEDPSVEAIAPGSKRRTHSSRRRDGSCCASSGG